MKTAVQVESWARLLLYLVVATALLCGCASAGLPSDNYFQDTAGWKRVCQKWRKKYDHAIIYTPSRPSVDEYISAQLFEKPQLRVAVMDTLFDAPPVQDEVFRYSGEGTYFIDEYRWRAHSNSKRRYPAARPLDCRHEVSTTLERALGRAGRFVVVDRAALELLVTERDLRTAFSSPAAVLKLGRIEGADALLLSRVSGLRYVILSRAEVEDEVKGLYDDGVCRVDLDVRMIDVATGRLLWSARTQYGIAQGILVPVILHPGADDDLPEVLTTFPGEWVARGAADYLVDRLSWKLSRKKGNLPDRQRYALRSHHDRAWAEEIP